MSRQYYQSELNRVKVDPVYTASLQIRSGNEDSKTKWLNLNTESVEELIKWLQSNFKVGIESDVTDKLCSYDPRRPDRLIDLENGEPLPRPENCSGIN